MNDSTDGDGRGVPPDLAAAIADGLDPQRTVRPPHACDFDDLSDVVARTSRLIQHLTLFKEIALARADATSGYANRRALAGASGMSASQLGRVLEGHGLPRDRRTHGLNLVTGFRTLDDGVLHLLDEAGLDGLHTFTLPVDTRGGRGIYACRELQFYYRADVPPGAAGLGRSAGYTLHAPEQSLIACMSEQVFDALSDDPRIDAARRPTGNRTAETRK